MSQNHSDTGQAGKGEGESLKKRKNTSTRTGEDGKTIGTEKEKVFFRVGQIAEKIWRNKWYQRFFTVLLVMMLGSGAFALRYIEQETSVDSVIEEYVQLFSAGDWEEMYEKSSAEEAGIPYSLWETAMSAGRTDSISSYGYKLTKTEDGIRYYTVTYREKNAEQSEKLVIALRETGEVLYHFFKTYEVTAAPLAIEGATVTVPEGVTFTFDSLSSEELDVAEEEAGFVYSLPSMPEGEYEVYLSGDTVEDQAYTVTVGENSKFFTWLEFDMEVNIAEEMEEHLAAVVLSVLSEAVEYGDEMECDYGGTIDETYGHDGLGDWNALGTAISDSLRLALPVSDEDAGSGDGSGEGADDESGEAEAVEVLEVTQLSVNSSETSSYDFIYPDHCTVKLVLECAYTAASSEVDILDPDLEESQTRTGTIHMEFVAGYLVDAEEWQILDCTYTSTYTMDAPAEEEEETEAE